MAAAFSQAHALPLHEGFDALVRAQIEELRRQPPLLQVVLRHLVTVARVESYRAVKQRMLDAFAGYVTAHRHEVDLGDLESASRPMLDCVEAITMDALFARGGSLAEDPRVQELLSVARRYFLLRA